MPSLKITAFQGICRELIRFAKALSLLLLFITVFLLVSCGPLYLSHNRTAQHLLFVLDHIEMPPHAIAVDREWNVGGYEGASTACEALAYVVIKSNEPRNDILRFYNDRFPSIQKREIDADCYVASFDQLPPLTPSDIRDACARTSTDQRKTTYAVWVKEILESQAWDVRGW